VNVSKAKPSVLVTMQRPLYERLTTVDARRKLKALAGDLVANHSETPWDSDEVIARIGGASAVISSWGSCVFDRRVLDAAPALEIICYAAGSVRTMAPPHVFERGIKVTHAAQLIAESVAEFTLMVALILLRGLHHYQDTFRQGGWNELPAEAAPARELYGKQYGIVGASMVGKSLVRLLRPFDVHICVHDPYLGDDDAQSLGVRRIALDELMATCDVISLHAPMTAETEGLINEKMIRSIKDDAVFINNARSWLVDSAAMLEELQKERFDTALDVFDEEPLEAKHPLRCLTRTLLTPHLAGRTAESHSRLAGAMIDELERYFRGEPLRYEVTPDMLASMA